jgi:uncharacterized protein (DUF305 family)
MKKSPLPIIAIVLVIVGLVGMAATITFIEPVGPAASGAGGNMDAMFIEQMIPHHEDAIAMAELALTRAEHPQIKQLAEDVIVTQSAEIDQMREWYREWFDSDVPDYGGLFGTTGRRSPGRMGGMMGGGAVDLEDLEAADEFDKVFIEQMIPHHQMGIMMSRMAGIATDRFELRGLTQSIIETQSREVVRMQEWYDEWYGR